MSKYKVIVFDLDGTLAESKSKVPIEMANALDRLMCNHQVAVISGGKWEQFELQLLPYLTMAPHCLPTCGTTYYKYTYATGWKQMYNEVLSWDESAEIRKVLRDVVDESGLEFHQLFGQQIENRGTQVTFSALGQKAPTHLKKKWDPDKSKRKGLVEELRKRLPQFEVRYGGTTSIDVTRKGIDKAHGMQQLMDHLNLEKSDILFIGDALQPDGNDYAVKAMGIDCIEVGGPEDTLKEVEKLLK
jgi:hypothetical protein